MNKFNKLLVIRPGGLGDCILSFPAIQSPLLQCNYLEVWVPRAVVPLIRFAGGVRAISSTGLDLLGIPGVAPPPELWDSLRGFDAIVSWYGANRDEFRAATAMLPIEFHASLPPADSLVHAADFFSSQVGAPFEDPSIDLGPVVKRDFVAIHPFSGSPKKNWPLERFDALARESGSAVEWCATAEQAPLLGTRTPVLVEEDLGKVARWLASARRYIGNDSGITHLAAAVGTPVLALFQNSDARIWCPRGRHVEILEAVPTGPSPSPSASRLDR